jgi:hypothetical protein
VDPIFLKSKDDRRAIDIIIELFNRSTVHPLYFICLLLTIALFNCYLVAQYL